MACDHVNRNVDTPIIDADSTLTETYGSQEASSFIHHYAEVGYHPLVINEFNSKVLLSSRLRAGSSYSSNGIIEELQTIFPYLYNRGNIHFRETAHSMTLSFLTSWMGMIFPITSGPRDLNH